MAGPDAAMPANVSRTQAITTMRLCASTQRVSERIADNGRGGAALGNGTGLNGLADESPPTAGRCGSRASAGPARA